MLAAGTTWLVINAGRKVAERPFPAQRSHLDPDRAIHLLCRRRHQLDLRRARRLSRLRPIHAALRAREPREGQAVRRQAGAGAGRAVSHRRSVSVFLQPDLRAGIHAEAVSRSGFQRARARHGNRPEPAVRLCRRVRRAAVDAMGAAESDRAHLSGKPAHEQPRHRAGLHRVGQYLQRQRLQSAALARRLQKPAARSARPRRSAPSWRAKA